MNSLFTFLPFLLLAVIAVPTSPAQNPPRLIPKPFYLKRSLGRFRITGETRLYTCPEGREAAEFLAAEIRKWRNIALTPRPMKKGPFEPGSIILNMGTMDPILGEGYTLSVYSKEVRIFADRRKGLFNGAVTLLQLVLLSRPEKRPSIPCLSIVDTPRFSWRGLMLDCSRTFQSISYIKKTIDRMAFYKMNVLHLHLTDDQGWRLEIERYPELTAKGARFPEKYKEPPSHQGFYTQDEIRDLVKYAAERNITILPEIEMPGHSLAALSCHPELSCTGGPFEIYPFFKGPGVTRDIYCAGKEATFAFLENVLSEATGLFPGKFFHIGGDEVPKARWKKCPLCQARIRGLGLKNEESLQGWFIRRIGKFLAGKGRRIVGWDEILRGGLPPGAVVMSWRGVRGGIAAAKAGHDAVMCPTAYCYFDYSYRRTPTEKVYSFEPVPPGLTPEQEKHILGLQANFWSHIDREPQKVDRQIFPRLLAVAEIGWSPRSARNWDDFKRRLKAHLPLLKAMGISYYSGEKKKTKAAPSRSGRPKRAKRTSALVRGGKKG